VREYTGNKTAYQGSNYLKAIFNKKYFDKIVRSAADFMVKYYPNAGVVCTGLSGTLAIAVAHRAGCPVCFLRKRGDDSHSSKKFEGYLADEVVLIDDLVDTGTTLKRVIADLTPQGVTVVASLLWNGDYVCPKISEELEKEVPLFTIDFERGGYLKWDSSEDPWGGWVKGLGSKPGPAPINVVIVPPVDLPPSFGKQTKDLLDKMELKIKKELQRQRKEARVKIGPFTINED